MSCMSFDTLELSIAGNCCLRVLICIFISVWLFDYCVVSLSVLLYTRSNKFIIFYEQKYVADFYISDFQTGLRALVKAGYGAKVAPFVNPTTVVDVTKGNRELSPNFVGWLADRKLSSDDRIMRLKEGYGLHYFVVYYLS